jgi:tetratricopeptide (TPR) repeat protein
MRKKQFAGALVMVGLILASPGVSQAAPPAPTAPDRVDVKWLTQPAEAAVQANQFPRAAVLYQGAISLDPEALDLLWRLAEIYTMGGQFSQAQETYERYAKATKDNAKRTQALGEIKRLATMPAPFVESEINQVMSEPKFALQAVNLGRRSRTQKKLALAIRYLEAAVTMDPTLVGVYRLLGELYAQLKDTARAEAFYVQYLRARPAGPLAELVRLRLKDSPALGKVTFAASFPSAVFINRFKLDAKRVTPFTDVLLPEGTYTVIMHNAQYHAAAKIKVVVKAGERKTVTFDFGLLDIQLTPWARVRANGRDLGLWNPLGMPVGRYRLVFTSPDEKQTMTKEIELKAGQRYVVVKWD